MKNLDSEPKRADTSAYFSKAILIKRMKNKT